MKKKLTELKENRQIHKLETSTHLSQYLLKQADDKHMEKFNSTSERKHTNSKSDIIYTYKN